MYKTQTNSFLKVQRTKDQKMFMAKEIDYSQMEDTEKKHIVHEVNIQRELKSPFIIKYIDRYSFNADTSTSENRRLP